MLKIIWIDDLTFTCYNKNVLCRVDLNVPIDCNNNILDDTKIKLIIPTINCLLNKGAKLILASHLGRPDGMFNIKYSLKFIAYRLEQLLNKNIIFIPNCIGNRVDNAIDVLSKNEVLLLDNLRFHSGEIHNDDIFAYMLGKKIDIYVNDAFACSHRKHSSIVRLSKMIKHNAGGLLLKKEIQYLSILRNRPKKPFLVIIGGKKAYDKLKFLQYFMHKIDSIIIGGMMLLVFLKIMGHNIGAHVITLELLDIANVILNSAKKYNVKIILPFDYVVGVNSFSRPIVKNRLSNNDICFDIGFKSIMLFKKKIFSAKTIFLNGPMGFFENSYYSYGTFSLFKILSNLSSLVIIGGGESISAINSLNLFDKFSHISTGGGASISFLNNNQLIGLKHLGFCY